MKKIIPLVVVIFAALAFGLSSCNPSSDNITPDNHIEDSIPKIIDNYLPSTAGSWWLYNSSLGDQFKREATGIDTLKSDLLMKFFTYTKLSTMDDDPEFFNRFDDSKYFTLFTFDSTEADANYIPLVVMKEDPYVGMEWLNEGSVMVDGYGMVDMNAICKIESLSDVVVTDDTTFNNVVKMKATLKAKVAGISWVNCGTITYWFVKQVGIVQQDYNIELKLMGITLYEKIHLDVLTDYHIQY